MTTLWLGNVLGPQGHLEAVLASQGTTRVGAVVEDAADKKGTNGSLTGPSENVESAAEKPAEFIPGAQAPILPWLPVLAAALIFGFGGYRVVRELRQAESEETAAVVDDSEPFSRALSVWNPVIASQLETPRELRRFMNRLRYSAVRLNGMAADSGFENSLSEEEIVSLAALYLLAPACIELTAEVDSADEFLSRVELMQQDNLNGEGKSLLVNAQLEALGLAIHNYAAEGGIATWGFDDNKIKIFNVLLQGIKVH